MNQEQVISKVKHILHSLRDKLHREHKESEIDFKLNEYDKMRIESLMKNELQYKSRSENVIKPSGNNRDISAI